MRLLFAASVGPVQGFIVAARKVRDLYAGSWIVSEVAKAAAKRLQEGGAELIFPNPEIALGPGSEVSVSNKVLAVVESESPRDLARVVEQAARSRVRRLCDQLQDPMRHDERRLVEHVEELLEFYAAWVPFPEGSDYRTCYGELEALLGARKLTKIFTAHKGVTGLPKSSLDGVRETVLPPKERRNQLDTRVREDEELDGTAFLKRFVRLGKGIRFDSVKEIAEAPYRGKAEPGDDLYYGILMADGDGMGAKIGALSKDAQKDLSARLSAFAELVRRRLDDDEYGCMTVFAGGDELIAMVPLHRLPEALEALRLTFQEEVNRLDQEFTISAGVAIVHEMEPLEDAKRLAYSAKQRAKAMTGKNALCITESPRSGAPIHVTEGWDWMLPILSDVISAYLDKKLSYGFGHELWDLLRRTPAELEEAIPDLAVATARHKRESNSAALHLVEANIERLEQLTFMMLAARRVARARKSHEEAGAIA